MRDEPSLSAAETGAFKESARGSGEGAPAQHWSDPLSALKSLAMHLLGVLPCICSGKRRRCRALQGRHPYPPWWGGGTGMWVIISFQPASWSGQEHCVEPRERGRKYAAACEGCYRVWQKEVGLSAWSGP